MRSLVPEMALRKGLTIQQRILTQKPFNFLFTEHSSFPPCVPSFTSSFPKTQQATRSPHLQSFF